jgi:hypothetical protein
MFSNDMREDIQVHWPQSPNNPFPCPFDKVLLDEIKKSDDIDIITGYVSLSSATNFGSSLIECAQRGGRVRILIGMAGVEGLSQASHDAWSSIHDQLQTIDSNSGILAYTSKIHAKLYIFSTRFHEKMYVGSQNFNFSSGNMELMLESSLHPEVETQVNNLFSDTRNLIPINSVTVKGSNTDPFTGKVTSAEIFHYDTHYDYTRYPLVESINLQAICEKNPIGSLNLYHGKGRLNRATGTYTPRPWYEVELTLGRDKYPGLPRDFRAFTDDGKIIELQRRSGGPAGQPELGLKDLTSRGNRQILGEWIKGKLQTAGALQIGEVIDRTTFETFGANQLQFYRMSDSEFLMHFSPDESDQEK